MSAARFSVAALLAFTTACTAHKAPPQKTEPPKALTASLIASSAPSAAAVPSAASCAEATAPRLNTADLKIGPTAKPFSVRPGLWIADESSALLSATADSSWAEGPIAIGGGNSATRAVNMARVPKALRAWLGRPVKVLGANGAVCETRLQRFLIRAQITPDLRTAEHWEGCAEGPVVPAETIANEVWRVTASAGRSLIAEFSAPCKGALLAVDPDLPAPAIAAPEPASAEVGAEAMTAFRQLPEYAQIQARFRVEHPELEGAWDDREAKRSISALTLPGRTPLFVVSVEVGSACKGFSAGLSALWGGGGPSSALTAIDNRRLTPSAIVDLDGTGGQVLLGPDGAFAARSVLRPKANADKIDVTRYERVFLLSVPYFPAPC